MTLNDRLAHKRADVVAILNPGLADTIPGRAVEALVGIGGPAESLNGRH
jgi:hypothetical protein